MEIRVPYGHIDFDGKSFLVNSRYEDRHRCREMGFEWDKEDKVYRTMSPLTLAYFSRSKLSEAALEECARQKERQDHFRNTYSSARDWKGNEKFPVRGKYELYPYQRVASQAIVHNPEGLLIADEMGLGKSLEVICGINKLGEKRTKNVLIVAPKVLLTNWKDEFAKYATTDRIPQILSSRSHPKEPGDGIFLINYDLLHRKEFKWLQTRKWGLVAADEVHYAKTPTAKRTKALVKILANADHRVGLTGTPMISRPVEFFHILKLFGWPDEYLPFTRRYCKGKQGQFGWYDKGAENLEELNHRVRGFCMVRRVVKDVKSDLPKKTRKLVRLDSAGYTKELRAELQAQRDAEKYKTKQQAIFDRGDISSEEYKQAVAYLRKPHFYGLKEITEARKATALAKVADVAAIVRDTVGEDDPVLLFAHHREVMELLRDDLAKDFRVALLYGGMTNRDREKAVKDFQEGKIDIFILSIGAANAGLNLFRSRHVIFAELDWNSTIMDQCEARSARIGQERPVLVQNIVVDGSIDAMIAKKQQQKRRNINKAVA